MIESQPLSLRRTKWDANTDDDVFTDVLVAHLGEEYREPLILTCGRAVRDVHLIYVPWDGKWERLRGQKRYRDLLRRSEWALRARG